MHRSEVNIAIERKLKLTLVKVMHLMSSNSDRARMVGSNFDRVRIVVVGDAGITCTVKLH